MVGSRCSESGNHPSRAEPCASGFQVGLDNNLYLPTGSRDAVVVDPSIRRRVLDAIRSRGLARSESSDACAPTILWFSRRRDQRRSGSTR
jgi:hypothetical protein